MPLVVIKPPYSDSLAERFLSWNPFVHAKLAQVFSLTLTTLPAPVEDPAVRHLGVCRLPPWVTLHSPKWPTTIDCIKTFTKSTTRCQCCHAMHPLPSRHPSLLVCALPSLSTRPSVRLLLRASPPAYREHEAFHERKIEGLGPRPSTFMSSDSG